MSPKKIEYAAWLPTKWEPADAMAIKALAGGRADEFQQKRALDFIIKLSGYYDLSFSPLSERETCFAEGKRFVGSQVVKLINAPLTSISKEPTENG